MAVLKKGKFRVIINEEPQTVRIRDHSEKIIKERTSRMAIIKIFKHRKLIAEGRFEVVHDSETFIEFLE